MNKRTLRFCFSLLLIVLLLSGAVAAPVRAAAEGSEHPFSPSAGTVSAFTEKGYHYTDYVPDAEGNWNPVENDADLYTVTVPHNATEVRITFPEDRLCYTYDATGNYLASCGAEGDGSYANNGQTGQSEAVIKADSAGDLPPYARVQTPYDANWSSTLLYAIALVREAEPDPAFSVSPGEVTASEENGYRYTVYGQDAEGNWIPTEFSADLRTVTVPAGTAEVTLTFPEDRICYAYDASGNYLASCGAEGDGSYANNGQTGQRTALVKAGADGLLPPFVQVQTPYDANWSSTTLFAVTFIVPEEVTPTPTDAPKNDPEPADPVPDPHAADVYRIVGDAIAQDFTPERISYDKEKKYWDSANDWIAMELARAGRSIPKAYCEQMASYLKDTNGVLHTSRYDYTNYARTILALTANGHDPRNANGIDLLAPLADLDAVTAQGINGPVYALLALDSHNYEIPKAKDGASQTTREALIRSILDAQLPDGGWDYAMQKADPDMTALALQALAPYCGTDETVRAAVDRALATLAGMQNEDGTFSSPDTGFTPAGESAAQVVVALTALGIDPASDTRFIKNGNSALAGLLRFYVPASGSDSAGFAHTAGSGKNAIATTQGFYALAAYDRFVNRRNSLYDMNDVTLSDAGCEPADEQENPSKQDEAPSAGGDQNSSGTAGGTTPKGSSARNTTGTGTARTQGSTTSGTGSRTRSANTADPSDPMTLILLLTGAAALLHTKKKADNNP